MVIRSGLLLSFAAVFLQIAVFLQPLLPKQYQIAPVCETITRALLLKSSVHSEHHSRHSAEPQHVMSSDPAEHEHDASHQCQYCTVYGNLVLPPELDVKEVLDRIQVRLIAFKRAYSHVWFVLQQLFLLPQGRAPPLFA
ncbi:DUF2946 family protein [Acinetobacter sp. HR7]|uniref:DUF2946 family protein n=1 Tax=Acinetobacter sp. HR7 TaxID=1509403 RepID=UPI000536734D|nr:DUF2946 family protein [Acinetobacter sp. HR7]KGT48653.1 hypothetical protein GW12_03060 [Acinetobacter sp. HR7]